MLALELYKLHKSRMRTVQGCWKWGHTLLAVHTDSNVWIEFVSDRFHHPVRARMLVGLRIQVDCEDLFSSCLYLASCGALTKIAYPNSRQVKHHLFVRSVLALAFEYGMV